MSTSKEFFNVKKKFDWTGWSEYPGTFGCQKCHLDTTIAYFNSDEGQIKWVCADGHESVIQLD